MLEIQGLHAYYGFVHALKGLNIKVGKGQVVTLLGANGAGKTSTLKCISGVLRPSEGKIIYKDKDITHESIENIVKAGIVQSPEGRQVFSSLSVKDNLMAGAFTINDPKKVQENLELAYNYFPRLKEREKQYAGTLSGGEQQMLAIARALMSSPELLILDEPSLGLAPLIVKDIFRIVKEINKTGTTILLVEQNAKQALGVSDYAYVLETGKILFEGPAKQMENDENIKKAYLGA